MRAFTILLTLALLGCEPRQIDLRPHDSEEAEDTGEDTGADDED